MFVVALRIRVRQHTEQQLFMRIETLQALTTCVPCHIHGRVAAMTNHSVHYQQSPFHQLTEETCIIFNLTRVSTHHKQQQASTGSACTSETELHSWPHHAITTEHKCIDKQSCSELSATSPHKDALLAGNMYRSCHLMSKI